MDSGKTATNTSTAVVLAGGKTRGDVLLKNPASGDDVYIGDADVDNTYFRLSTGESVRLTLHSGPVYALAVSGVPEIHWITG